MLRNLPKVIASGKAKIQNRHSGSRIWNYVYCIMCDGDSAEKFRKGEKTLSPVVMLELLLKFYKRLSGRPH